VIFIPFHTIDDLEFKLCHPRVPLEKSIWPRLVHRFTTVGTFEERLAHIIAEKWLGSASLDDHDMCGNFYYQNSKNSLSRCSYVFFFGLLISSSCFLVCIQNWLCSKDTVPVHVFVLPEDPFCNTKDRPNGELERQSNDWDPMPGWKPYLPGKFWLI